MGMESSNTKWTKELAYIGSILAKSGLEPTIKWG